jgi:mannan endo-1,6-alpha-mannosidase
MLKVGYIDAETSAIYNGGHTEKNCTNINHDLFSYPAAHIVRGASILYNRVSLSILLRDRFS